MIIATVPAGIVSDAVTDAIATAQAWFVDKIDWLLDPMWVWYGWGLVALVVCLVIGFFVPFKWARAGLGFFLLLVGAYIAGGRQMHETMKAERAKLKAQLKAEKAKKKEGW